MGCGNGRDSYFFGDNGIKVVGIDFASQPAKNNLVKFQTISLKDFIKSPCKYNIVYSRFFLHSISTKEIVSTIKWTKEYFMAEFRDKTDKPKIYTNHKRNLIDGEVVKKLLLENNFEIIYYTKSKGLAKYRNEDPVIVRVIARRKK